MHDFGSPWVIWGRSFVIWECRTTVCQWCLNTSSQIHNHVLSRLAPTELSQIRIPFGIIRVSTPLAESIPKKYLKSSHGEAALLTVVDCYYQVVGNNTETQQLIGGPCVILLTPFKPLPTSLCQDVILKCFFANHYQIRPISMPTLACVCFFFYDDIFSNQGGFPIHIIYFTMKINASSTDTSVLCIDREHILCSEKSRIFMEVSFQK